MGFMQGAVALLNRSNHINTEGCRIPEVNIRNSSGKSIIDVGALLYIVVFELFSDRFLCIEYRISA